MRTSVVVLALGVAFDIASNGALPGLSVPLFVLLAASALFLTLPRSPSRSVVLASAVAVTLFVPFRASEPLLGLDIAVAAGLLGVAATGGALFEESLVRAFDRAFALTRAVFTVPVLVLAPFVAAVPRLRSGRARVAVRSMLIAVPIVVVFAALLGAADPVFARTLLPSFPRLRLGGIASHVFLTGLGVAAAGGLWAASARPLPSRVPADRARLRTAEWAPALGALLALFAAFVVVQLAVLFAGSRHVDVTPGLTYAEYARSGFFQLLAAGGLTVLVVVGAWDVARRADARARRLFALLVTGIVGTCLVILASAAKRLALYQDAFGFTNVRLAAWFAIGVVAAVLVALAALVWLERRRAVLGVISLILLAAVLAGNVINPNAFVAARNVERYRATGKLDTQYLVFSLGADAVPAITAVLPSLAPPDRDLAVSGLCEITENAGGGWRSWNLPRRNALSTIRSLPIDCGAVRSYD